jgi:hypothetical protein
VRCANVGWDARALFYVAVRGAQYNGSSGRFTVLRETSYCFNACTAELVIASRDTF